MSLFFLGVIAGVVGIILVCLMLPDEDEEDHPVDKPIETEEEWDEDYDHEEGNL